MIFKGYIEVDTNIFSDFFVSLLETQMEFLFADQIEDLFGYVPRPKQFIRAFLYTISFGFINIEINDLSVTFTGAHMNKFLELYVRNQSKDFLYEKLKRNLGSDYFSCFFFIMNMEKSFFSLSYKNSTVDEDMYEYYFPANMYEYYFPINKNFNSENYKFYNSFDHVSKSFFSNKIIKNNNNYFVESMVNYSLKAKIESYFYMPLEADAKVDRFNDLQIYVDQPRKVRHHYSKLFFDVFFPPYGKRKDIFMYFFEYYNLKGFMYPLTYRSSLKKIQRVIYTSGTLLDLMLNAQQDTVQKYKNISDLFELESPRFGVYKLYAQIVYY